MVDYQNRPPAAPSMMWSRPSGATHLVPSTIQIVTQPVNICSY